MTHISFGRRKLRLPNHPLLRMAIGFLLIAGGIVGFLPILGFWMIPLGLIILSIDLPMARRLKRRLAVTIGHSLKRRWPWLAGKLGFGLARRA